MEDRGEGRGGTTDGGPSGITGHLRTRTWPLEEPLLKFAGAEWRIRSISHTLLLLLVTMLASGLVVIGVMDLLELLGLSEEGAPVVWYGIEVSVHFAVFLLVGLGYLYWMESGPRVGIGMLTLRDWLVGGAGLVGLFAVSVLSGVLFDRFGVETAENVAIQRGMEHPELFLVLLPIQLFLTAPAEELLFRGIVQGLFRAAYGVLPAILIASLVFGLVHLPALAGGSGQFAVVGVLVLSGAILGLVYEYSGNLAVPIVVHAVWNVVVFGSSYLEAAGTLGPY